MYTLRVDLSVPASLYDRLDACCPAPTSRAIPPEWLSPYQRRLARVLGLRPAQLSQPKLVADLHPKRGYVVHGAVLKLYLHMGLKLDRIIHGVCYRQEAFLRPYIEHLMQRRREAKLPFENLTEKLKSNAVFGRCLMSPEKFRSLDVVRTREQFLKKVSKPHFQSFTIVGEDLSLVESRHTRLKMHFATQVGTTCLDLSKMVMQLHFKTIQDNIPGFRLAATDTDSFLCEIQSEDINQDLSRIAHIMDFSSLPTHHPLYNECHAGQPGYLKIENAHDVILSMALTREKAYALQLIAADGTVRFIFKCKGAPKAPLHNQVVYEDYLRCIQENILKEIQYCSIRSDGQHRLFTMRETKVILSPMSNKRYVEESGVASRDCRPGGCGGEEAEGGNDDERVMEEEEEGEEEEEEFEDLQQALLLLMTEHQDD